MLSIHIFTLVSLGYYAHGAALANDRQAVHFTERAAITIKTACLKNADQSKYEEALNELNDLTNNCWNVIALNISASPVENARTCFEHRTHALKCLIRFTKKLKPCLELKGDDIGQLILDMYGNYSYHQCEYYKDFAYSGIETSRCLTKFILNPSLDPVASCYDNSEVFGSDSNTTVVNKAKLCDDFLRARPCQSKIFEDHCPDAHKLKAYVLGMFEAAATPCQDIL